jgi:hypothetical protein
MLLASPPDYQLNLGAVRILDEGMAERSPDLGAVAHQRAAVVLRRLDRFSRCGHLEHERRRDASWSIPLVGSRPAISDVARASRLSFSCGAAFLTMSF